MAASNENPGELDGYLLTAVGDTPDFRDYRYQPALLPLRASIDPPKDRDVLDQGREGACTGFGLAAVINNQLAARKSKRRASPRMLYEIAKRYDEWKGEEYAGSSCRGAVRGWYNTGVCSEKMAPYVPGDEDWELTLERARDARATTVGAYYRVTKRLSDYHAALNEVGALYVSASVHEGWRTDAVRDGEIPRRPGTIGGHAFAIVGYDERGFWVQNSWGESWGDRGVARWLYEDWLENVKDAWVLRLGLSTPQVWTSAPTLEETGDGREGLFRPSPRRGEILGHFVHIDDGHFDDHGKYWMNLHSIQETACYVADSEYQHLLLYAHGGLNSISASARRIAAMKNVFKANGIYPFHFMYDTGLLEEVKDVVLGKREDAEARAGGFTDFTDRLIEDATRHGGRAIWREMKQGAERPFTEAGAGTQTIEAFLDAFAADGVEPKKVHIVGHSTGAILLAALLEALASDSRSPRIRSCSLLAPACTHARFNDVYRPFLKERDANRFGIDRMTVYNLEDELERDDQVAGAYRKSLLYLVSNAFEEKRGERLLGLQKFRRYLGQLPGERILEFALSDGSSGSGRKTASTSHGGFDNDPTTMNHVLRSVLGSSPPRPFTASDLDY